ncbi:putative membrane protein [Parasphingopyxis lamellibrachiae]|uniref:Putative membrane protein n=1 Tax=Parasphingopyxis lamellibrachiae TaxID=680125 RepID=A0A3D9FHY3_9SPHN|nr:putative membrane protein [Parasphingopyxis lamellibrachiae]
MGEGRGRRGKLEFDPPSMSRPSPEERETVRPRPAGPGQRSGQAGNPEPGTRRYAAAATGTNKPMILSILYLTSVLVGLTGLVAFILALVWKSEPGEEWEQSHYQYHILTFLLWLGTTILSFILIVTIIGALIGIPMLFLAVIWVLVRSIMSLVRASNREPMPNPGTWLV